jgi:ribonuclease J
MNNTNNTRRYNQRNNTTSKTAKTPVDPTKKLRIIPLGGLGEIGKNMMALEYGDDILVIDCGVMFPDGDMVGIDLVIPDTTYLVEHQDKIRGVAITHAHEDHIGALPYVIPQINAPIFCTKLAKGLISTKMKDRKSVSYRVISPGSSFTAGCFKVEFFPVCHSIPDAVGMIITTPVGIIVHTGDFKIDYTPVSGKPTDLSRLSQIGGQGVLLLMSDSTYAEVPGYTPSERVVGESIERIVANAKGRVIITTFASLISRMQQIVDAAVKHHRKVFFIGRSMMESSKIAQELGYLVAPPGVIGTMDELNKTPKSKVIIVTTGSQGEPTSGLVRIANRAYKQVNIIEGDTVIISASPIPGNEGLVNRVIDTLFKEGAEVFYGTQAGVHVHGHAAQEELKLILTLVKPKFFLPVHGEYRHLTHHAKLANSIGIPKTNTFVLSNGEILELNQDSAKVAGKVTSGNVYVDGLSVGDVGGIVLRNRRMLSRDGIVVAIVTVNGQTGELVVRPDIVSRGFIDVNESKEMIEGAKDVIVRTMKNTQFDTSDAAFMENDIKATLDKTLDKYFYENTKRRPMIMLVIVQV